MFGFWSIVPPLVAVGLAIWTKRVIFSLFISVWVGGLIFTGGHPLAAIAASFDWIKDVMIDPWDARFLVLTMLLGSGAAFMFKTGGSHALTRVLEKRLTNGKRSQLLAWILGIVVFFNDYANSVIVGNASRDINAKYRVSREKLSYILDSTASPMATFGPISDWIGYQVGLIGAAFIALKIVDVKAYFVFLQSIPWNFYCILSLIAVPMLILGKDFGPMADAELRAKKTGKLVADGGTPLSSVEADLGKVTDAEKASIWNFILPLITLIGVGIWAIWYTGGGGTGKSIMDALADTEVDIALTWAAFAMTVVGLVLALIHGMSLEDCEKTVLGGFKTMLPAVLIMVLAWSVGSVCSSLGTADFVVNATKSWMSAALLPFIIFLVCMFISFATGTSWGTMAIITPIGVPLAYAIGGIPLVTIAIGSIFAGAIFGDHCSPISDTTVMSSIFAESDHIAHVTTQIPYAMVVAGISAVLYLLSPMIKNAFVLLAVGIVAQFFILRYLGNAYQSKFSKEDRLLLEE